MDAAAHRFRYRPHHAAARTDDYVFHQLIPYIGNKRKLLPLVAGAVERTGVRGGLFLDLFAGSGVVGRMAKRMGFRVHSNDWEPYALAINGCYIGCNSAPALKAIGGPGRTFETLNGLPPVEGWVTRHLCPRDDAAPDLERERLFYMRANGMRLDAMRGQIERWTRAGLVTPREQAYLLAPLLYAACYTSNTSGVFKGFHRGWGGRTRTALHRIASRLELSPPRLFDNGHRNEVVCMDAAALADTLARQGTTADIAYLDPPYNQHPYGSNYHVLNSLALWDRPALSPTVTGRGDKAAIRTDWRAERRSAYNHGGQALEAFVALLDALRARWILASYSTEGNMPLDPLLEAACERGRTTVSLRAYKRYRVSSQRFSKKPMNVEFVLSIDTARRGAKGDAAALSEQIRSAEQAALAEHQAQRPRGERQPRIARMNTDQNI